VVCRLWSVVCGLSSVIPFPIFPERGIIEFEEALSSMLCLQIPKAFC